MADAPAAAAAPAYTAADFSSAMLAHLPEGPVWPRDPDAVLPRVVAALAPTYERMSARAAALLRDAPGRGLDELLPEWEATLGLPDPCHGPEPTREGRIASVLAAITARGGQSADYFVAVAAALGIPVRVRSYAPAHCGYARCGDLCLGIRWAHAWSVTAPLGEVRQTRCGDDCGIPIRRWDNAVLECVLRGLSPAHTELFFLYTGDDIPAQLDADFILDVSELY